MADQETQNTAGDNEPADPQQAPPARSRAFRIYQFSTRTILVVMIVVALVLGIVVQRGGVQRAAVDEIHGIGGQVFYAHQVDADGNVRMELEAPGWSFYINPHYVRTAALVEINGKDVESALPALKKLAGLHTLVVITEDPEATPNVELEGDDGSINALEYPSTISKEELAALERELPGVKLIALPYLDYLRRVSTRIVPSGGVL